MKDLDFDLLFRKAEELRALFTLGQRFIPFLEDLFKFVSEIKPLLDDINSSIQENLKKMPNASKQLSKVTEATEMATTEIMDIVDGLIYKSTIISSNMKRMYEIEPKLNDSPLRIMEIIYKAARENKNIQEYVPQLSQVIENLKQSPNKEYDELYKATTGILGSIEEDSNSIMISLQVQDITSQQIAAVNHLLETIQDKLAHILTKFQSTDVVSALHGGDEHVERTNVTDLHRRIAFDPDAVDSITMKETRQDDIDALLLEHAITGKISDSSHDPQKAPELKPIPKEPEATVQDDDGMNYFNQDDIDALFGK